MKFMRKLLINTLIIFLTIVSCSQIDENSGKNINWLIGNWERTNNDSDEQTFENWKKVSVDEYIGVGYTLNMQDTIFKEDLRLIKIKGIWNFKVTGVNENPTFFPFSKQTGNSFICENMNNEFPKTIKYSIEGSELVASISDGNTEILFYFRRLISK